MTRISLSLAIVAALAAAQPAFAASPAKPSTSAQARISSGAASAA